MDKDIRIGNVRLDNPLCLAPMLGVNCTAFRLMCRNNGAALVYSPMIHSLGLVKAEKNRDIWIDFIKEERPLAVQIIGRDPDIMAESLQYIEPYADIIDINFGCPDKDVLGQKMGAYFSKHPEQMTKIVEKVVSATSASAGIPNTSTRTLQRRCLRTQALQRLQCMAVPQSRATAGMRTGNQ